MKLLSLYLYSIVPLKTNELMYARIKDIWLLICNSFVKKIIDVKYKILSFVSRSGLWFC